MQQNNMLELNNFVMVSQSAAMWSKYWVSAVMAGKGLGLEGLNNLNRIYQEIYFVQKIWYQPEQNLINNATVYYHNTRSETTSAKYLAN